MKTRCLVVPLALVLAGLGAAGCGRSAPAPAAPAADAAQVWTCSMHPQIRQPGPGRCPLCAMDLIPAGSGAPPSGARDLTLPPASIALAEIETAPVERRAVSVPLRLPATVEPDETRLVEIAARVAGRIEKLHVAFTGAVVRPGEPLADVYSPELVSAQRELIEAVRAGGRLLDAARQKLRLWGLTAGQVAEMERRTEPSATVAILAPAGGTVLDRAAVEGAYVEEGARLFSLADLSTVWVQAAAYAEDLPWIRPGQAAEFTTKAVPGVTFTGRVDFVDPVLDAGTRSARVRVTAPNGDGRLKPGMYATVVVHAAPDGGEAPLVIPATAPLVTGARAVVYVADPVEPGRFEGREIVLGARAGDWQIVASGLGEGERVVSRGAFKIDSSLQIQAQPSMMNPPEEAAPAAAAPGGAPRPQTKCPVMGGDIDRAVFVDHEGLRIYFCCAGCDATFRMKPAAYIAKMRAQGVEPERSPAPPAAPKTPANPHAGHAHP